MHEACNLHHPNILEAGGQKHMRPIWRVACFCGCALWVLSGPEYSLAPHASQVHYAPLRCHYTCGRFGTRLLIPVACILMGVLPTIAFSPTSEKTSSTRNKRHQTGWKDHRWWWRRGAWSNYYLQRLNTNTCTFDKKKYQYMYMVCKV
jgi:hypothetical protein